MHKKNGGFLLVFDKACNVRRDGDIEQYFECEKTYLHNTFVSAYPRLVEEILTVFSSLSDNLELIDQALCETADPKDAEACKVDHYMVDAQASEALNTVRMFILAFLNSDEESWRVPKDSHGQAEEGGLVPTLKQT